MRLQSPNPVEQPHLGWRVEAVVADHGADDRPVLLCSTWAPSLELPGRDWVKVTFRSSHFPIQTWARFLHPHRRRALAAFPEEPTTPPAGDLR